MACQAVRTHPFRRTDCVNAACARTPRGGACSGQPCSQMNESGRRLCAVKLRVVPDASSGGPFPAGPCPFAQNRGFVGLLCLEPTRVSLRPQRFRCPTGAPMCLKPTVQRPGRSPPQVLRSGRSGSAKGWPCRGAWPALRSPNPCRRSPACAVTPQAGRGRHPLRRWAAPRARSGSAGCCPAGPASRSTDPRPVRTAPRPSA